MVAWNFWRWLGDDYKNAGALKEGKIIRYFLEGDGSERRGDVINISIRARNRVTVDRNLPFPDMSTSTGCRSLRTSIRETRPARRSWRCGTRVPTPKMTSSFMFLAFAAFAAFHLSKDARPWRPASLTMMTSIVLTVKSPTLNTSYSAKKNAGQLFSNPAALSPQDRRLSTFP